MVVVQGSPRNGHVVAQQARRFSRRAAAPLQYDGAQVLVWRERGTADRAPDRADAERDRTGFCGIARTISGQGRRADLQGPAEFRYETCEDAGGLTSPPGARWIRPGFAGKMHFMRYA